MQCPLEHAAEPTWKSLAPLGCGKRTVCEALGQIYEVAGEPQPESTFPFAGIPGAEVPLCKRLPLREAAGPREAPVPVFFQ